MLSKIQYLLESDSISPECRAVLEQAKLQTNLLKALPDFLSHPAFQRYVTDHGHFWQENVKYPLVKFDESPVIEEVTELDCDTFVDYEIGIACSFTWKSCDYEKETFNVKFLASWLNAKEEETPWRSQWVKDLIYECKLMLSYSPYLSKNKENRNNELASLIGVSENSLEAWSTGEQSEKIIRLKNLHLFLRMVTYNDWQRGRDYKDSIKDNYVFLINTRYVFDENDEDGSCSFIGFINSLDKHLSEKEMKTAIDKTLIDEKEQEEAEKEFAMYKKLEKKFKKDTK